MGLRVPNAPGLGGAGAIALAFALDALYSEPSRQVHPVALFGRLVAPIDRQWRSSRLVGTLATACLPLSAAAVAASAVAAADRHSSAFGAPVAAALVLFSTTSRRMLTDTARAVVDDSEDDLPRARRDLRALAGRPRGELSPGGVRSAVVESVSENFADGFVAPLLAFALPASVSLPAAAGATAWVKAVNTMDSMLGYRSTPTGWAPARLDDCVMWIPARLSACLLALAAADPRAPRRAAAWAHAPPSPNSGWPMATLAALLDVRLEKPDVYALAPSNELPTVAEARAGIDLVDRAASLAVLVLCSILLVLGVVAQAETDDADVRGPKRPADRNRNEHRRSRSRSRSRPRSTRMLDALVSRTTRLSRWVSWS